MRKQASERLADWQKGSPEDVKSVEHIGRMRHQGWVRGYSLHEAKGDLAKYLISDCAEPE